jgi:DNA-binding NarL/FixJ family response regulator
LIAAPRKGRRPRYVLYAPWRGFAERPWFDALLFRGIVMAEQNLPDLPLPPEKWRDLVERLQLPPQQIRIVELILRNCCDKQIATELGLKVPTVRTYLQRTYMRLDVSDRVELVLRLFALSHRTDHLQ